MLEVGEVMGDVVSKTPVLEAGEVNGEVTSAASASSYSESDSLAVEADTETHWERL